MWPNHEFVPSDTGQQLASRQLSERRAQVQRGTAVRIVATKLRSTEAVAICRLRHHNGRHALMAGRFRYEAMPKVTRPGLPGSRPRRQDAAP